MTRKAGIAYLRKAYTVLRREGVGALLNVLYTKVVITFNWRWRSILHSLRMNTRSDWGMAQYHLILFCITPYDGNGGGQRSAQLARAALRTGMQVLYVYADPKYDFEKRSKVSSAVDVPNLFYKPIKSLSTQEFIRFLNKKTTVVFEIPHPQFVKYLEIARDLGIRTVFELIGDWSAGVGGEWFHKEIFQIFVDTCIVTTGTSKLLVDHLNALGRHDTMYLPNAANEYVFNRHNVYSRPPDLPDGKLALYSGSMEGEGFGWEYIRESALANPDLAFCLVGGKPIDIPISLPPSVYFLGEKKHDTLPAYLSSADLCLLPFTTSQLNESVSPIKVFEYLFMAKPVISSLITEVKGLPNVSIAQSESEFAQLCKRLKKMDGNTFDNIRSTDDFISQNSWFSRLQNIIGLNGEQNVSVIILIHNNRNIIGHCLHSLLRNCSSYLSEVIVVDNASDDGGAEFVMKNYQDVRVIRNPVNGCSSGRNLGVNASSGKYLAFFDSDQWFTGGFCFEEALAILKVHPEIGAVGWAAGWLDLRAGQLHGSIADYYPRRGVNAKAAIHGYRTDITYLGTGGLFLSRSVFEATGGFDTAYDPTSFEDTDLSFSIKNLGFKLAYRDLTCIHHEAHQTTTASVVSPAYNELYKRNSSYFLKKWKEYPHHFVRYTM